MRQRTIWAIAAGALLLTGCEGSATHQVEVRPPAVTPAPVPSVVYEPLPLPEHPVLFASLRLDPRAGVDILVAHVQASLAAGQEELKMGNTEKGQADLDK